MAGMVDVLLIVPHPDDEVFSCGGLFTRLAARGRAAATLTLTRGGAGRNLGLCAQEELPALRERELRRSTEALGVAETIVWDYPDFVTEAGRGLDPRPGLAGESADELVARIAGEIARLEPRVVITFPPNGSNGHPDHVATNHLVLAALEEGSHLPDELYYFASDRPYDGEVRPGFLAPEEIRVGHLPPTHYLELGAEELETKLRAMAMHESQARSVLAFMRLLARRLRLESFHRARPAWPRDEGPRTVPWL